MLKPHERGQPIGNPIEPKFEGETAVLIATGPSISREQVDFVRIAQRENKCKIFTVNIAYQLAPETDVQVSCNEDWWNYYWPRDHVLRDMPGDKYTWFKYIADKYKIKYIHAAEKSGLSTDPRTIHINKGSGPMAINVALHYGVKKLLLIGHDMKFAPDYNGQQKKAGSAPRHYFGEYPKELRHWPSVKVGKSNPGTLDGLIEAYNTMPSDLKKKGMKVINCTPNSALSTFPMSTLEKEL
jgi:hypothetical protein